MAIKPSKHGHEAGLVPDRKHYGTERVTKDPSQDDALEPKFNPMKEGKMSDKFRKGYETMKMPEHKAPKHKTASVGKDRVGPAWKGPKGRKK